MKEHNRSQNQENDKFLFGKHVMGVHKNDNIFKKY